MLKKPSDMHFRTARSIAVLSGLAFGLAACVSPQTSPLSWYPTQNALQPQGMRINICHGFGCHHQTRLTLANQDIDSLAQIMEVGRASPSAEREAIAEAVMWMEARVGPVIGSDGDVGGLDMWNAGEHGQMDCLDEATNTTTTLLILGQNGLLNHHTVGYPVARGFFLDGRYPHATAVVEETETGERWAIDPWPYANAEDVDVMTLDAWYATFPLAG